VPQRTLKASGSGRETRWPPEGEVTLNRGLGKGEKERAVKAGAYALRVAEPGGPEHRVLLANQEEFSRLAAATAVPIRVEGGQARLREPAAAPPRATP